MRWRPETSRRRYEFGFAEAPSSPTPPKAGEHPLQPAGTWHCSASDRVFVVLGDDGLEADGLGFRHCIEKINDPIHRACAELLGD